MAKNQGFLFPLRKRQRLGNSKKSSKIKDLRCC
nr:MAG TPA: hypothetical protein [Caudoviricetes sp.]